MEKRAVPAFTFGNAIMERGIDSELYSNEVEVGDRIGQGIDGTVYKAKVPDTDGFDKSKTYALKKDYGNGASLENEYKTYKAIDGQSIGPIFEAIVQDMESLDNIGILIEYIDARPADKGSKDDARGAVTALKKMHDVGYIHGDIILGNILVNKSDGKVVFIDFVRSEATNDARKKEEDFDQLRAAFSDVKFNGDDVAE
jgi:serine/threonine protein kinase